MEMVTEDRIVFSLCHNAYSSLNEKRWRHLKQGDRSNSRNDEIEDKITSFLKS